MRPRSSLSLILSRFFGLADEMVLQGWSHAVEPAVSREQLFSELREFDRRDHALRGALRSGKSSRSQRCDRPAQCLRLQLRDGSHLSRAAGQTSGAAAAAAAGATPGAVPGAAQPHARRPGRRQDRVCAVERAAGGRHRAPRQGGAAAAPHGRHGLHAIPEGAWHGALRRGAVAPGSHHRPPAVGVHSASGTATLLSRASAAAWHHACTMHLPGELLAPRFTGRGAPRRGHTWARARRTQGKKLKSKQSLDSLDLKPGEFLVRRWRLSTGGQA